MRDVLGVPLDRLQVVDGVLLGRKVVVGLATGLDLLRRWGRLIFLGHEDRNRVGILIGNKRDLDYVTACLASTFSASARGRNARRSAAQADHLDRVRRHTLSFIPARSSEVHPDPWDQRGTLRPNDRTR